ncbi:MAG: hypothetical protein AB7O97_12405 [Planctomycetota bacterium]
MRKTNFLRRGPGLLLGALAVLPACGTAGYLTVIEVDPPSAALYINGQRVGNGDRQAYTLSFDRQDRIYLQATARGFEPDLRVYGEMELANQLDTVGAIKITLKEHR